MKEKSGLLFFLLTLVLGAAALFGFSRLFVLRFQAGDVYPPYSSLRADPLGTKVLYDALHEVDGLTVTRNFQSLDKVRRPDDATIFYAGAPASAWPLEEVKHLENLAKNGARIIINFLPEAAAPKKESTAEDEKPQATPKEKTDDDEMSMIGMEELGKRWGFSPDWRPPASGPEPSPRLVAHAMGPGIEPVLSWHTALTFRKPSDAWHTLYRCEEMPVIIERVFGRGSIVLCSDSFFLSNEAQRAERAPRLLAWLVGARPRAVFEETHLGVEESTGIAMLVRKYRLGRLLAALAALGGLFIWQTASPFLPPEAGIHDEEIVTGKDAASGFMSLLRRGIAPSRLMTVCVDEWKKSFAHAPGRSRGTLARIEAAALAAGGKPVEAYQTISQILAEKK